MGASVRVSDRPRRVLDADPVFPSQTPAPGSVGVVVGLSDMGRGLAVKVAFAKPFDERGGGRCEPSENEPAKFSFDADDLDVLSLGAFHDDASSTGRTDPGTTRGTGRPSTSSTISGRSARPPVPRRPGPERSRHPSSPARNSSASRSSLRRVMPSNSPAMAPPPPSPPSASRWRM